MYAGEEIREGQMEEFNLLVGLGLRFAGANAFGEKDLHGFREEARRGIVADEARPLAGTEAGLLNELAAGGGEGGFAGFDTTSGQLEEELAGGVAILALNEG